VITSPSPGDLLNQSTVVVSGSLTDPTPSSGIDRVEVNGVNAEVIGGSWVATLTGQADGPLTIQAQVWDNAGNTSLSAPVGITIDATKPLVFISLPTSGQIFATTTVVVSGTATDPGGSGIDWVKVNGVTATGTNNWTVTLTGLSQGANILIATAKDIANNSGNSAPVSITVDSLPPLVAITSPPNGATVSGPDITVRGTVSDATLGVGSVVVNGETSTIDHQAGTFIVTLPGQSPGPLTIIATATDLNGNTADSSPITVNVGLNLLSVFITSPLDGSAINTSVPTVEGNFTAPNDPGSVDIMVNGVTAATITTGTNSGSFTATLTGLTDGPHTITAVANDGIGTASDTIWITVDTADPLVSITSPTHLAILNDSEVVVNGTFSDATSGVRWVTVNGITAELNRGAGSYTATLTGQPEGPLTIQATARDKAGNTKSSDPVLVTVDTVAPAISIATPAEGEYLNISPVVVTGMVTDPAPSSGISLVMVNGQTAAYYPGSGTWTVTLSLSEGPQDITAQAWDQAGNPSLFDSVGITVDTQPPAVSITSPTDGSYLNTFNVVVTGTATDPAPSSGISLVMVNGQTAAYNPGSGTWTATLSLSEGSQDITAQAWDQAGNPSLFDSVGITVDTQPPAVSITSPTDGSYLNTVNIVVTGTVTDPAPSSGISLVMVNGETAAYNAGLGTWSVTLSLSEGPQNISAQAWDTANNQEIESINITVDTTDPLVAITTPLPGSQFNIDTVVVSGTATDAGSGISQVTVNSQVADYDPALSTWSVTLSGLTEGPLTLIATAVDNLGHSADSSPVAITLDYTLPLISITSPSEGDIIATDWLTVTGTASDLNGIDSVTVNGQSADYNPGLGTWSVTLSGLAEGELEIAASAADNAGNSADSMPVRVTVDYSPPLVAITYPQDGTTVGGPTVPVAGTVSDAVSGVQQVIVNGVEADVDPVAHAFIALLPGQANNSPLTIIATATDNANNQADSALVTVMVKYTDLTVTITNPLNGAKRNTPNVLINGVFTFDDPSLVDITVNGLTATINEAARTFNVTLPGQPEGPLTITAEAVVFLLEPAYHNINITLDFTPPSIAITSPLAGAFLRAADDTSPWLSGVQITATVSTDAEDGQLATLTANGITHTDAVTGGIGSFSNVTLTEGPNTLIARVNDQAGNASSPNQITVFLDTAAPTVAIASPTPGSVSCTSVVVVSGTVTDPDPSSGINRVIINPGGVEADVTGDSWAATLVSLPEGSVTIDATAEDNSGNSTVSSPVNITADYTPPILVITSPSPGDYLDTSTVTLRGTADDPGCGVVLVLVNGQTANGTYTWSITFIGEPEGSNTYSVEAVDNCNHQADPPISVNITVDHSAPSVSITTPTSGTYFCTSTVIVSGTASDLFSPISLVRVNGVTAEGGESWTATLTGLADGLSTIIAIAYDQAGNSASSSPVDIATDGLAPAVTILSPTDGGYVNSTTVTVSGTATDGSGSGVALILVNGETATGTENWSITFAGQSGNPSYSAVAIDYCGQQSSIQAITITIDLSQPTVELVSPAEGSCWTSSAVEADAVCNDVGGKVASCQVRIDGGAWYDIPATISGLSDGPHTAEARAVDRGGSESPLDSHNFTVDTNAPIVSITSPSPDSWVGPTVVITGTVSDTIEVGDSAALCLTSSGGEDCVIFTLAALTATPTYSESGSLDADFGNVDGDGDLDIVVANHNGQNRLYINDGNGVFTDSTSGRMPPDSDLSYDVELTDVDGDLALDIFVSNYGQNRLYLNDGSGNFTDETASQLPVDSDQSRDAELGDVNGDGNPDIIIANYNGQNRLYLNDGSGFFSDATELLPEDNDGSFDLELGDVDRDGDPDILVSNWGEQNRLYLNDGFGTFSDGTEHLPEDTDYSRDADLVDINGDLYPDLVIANYFGQNRLYINDGNWGAPMASFIDYTTTNLPSLGDNSIDVGLADIDDDGDPDLIVANYHQQNRLYLNDGSGVFSDITDPHLPADMNFSRDADFGDVDGDGDPDIIFANYLEQNLLYINNYGTVVRTVMVDPATGDFTGIFTQVSQGYYTATVTSWDNCGNEGSASVSFQVDATLPVVVITSPTNGVYFNTTTIVITGTADDTDSGVAAVLVNGQTASGTYSWSITFSNQYGEPVEVGFRDTADYAFKVFVLGDYAYVADYGIGLAIIDVSDPANP
ncbi:MAG: VCBS repeat-containing protein, partial [Deltaproteobacteria bacterium]